MANISTYLADKLLDHSNGKASFTMPAAVYMSLHTAAPDISGTPSNEVTGGSYARQAITWNSAAANAATNNATVTFASMPVATVTYFGIYDAASAGNLLRFGALTASKTTSSGDTLQFNSATVTVGEA